MSHVELGLLDENGRRAVAFAHEEARLLGHPEVGDDHLLLGIARTEPDLVGVPIDALRARVVAGRSGQQRATDASPAIGPTAASAIATAIDDRGGAASPVDILAAIATASGLAAEALARIGVDSMADAPDYEGE